MIKKTKEKELTERLKEGCFEDFDDYEEDIEEDVAAAIANFECVDDYISKAHDGDIEEEAID